MQNPEMREFTSAEIDGPKNAMGYPEVPYVQRRLETQPIIKTGVPHRADQARTNPPKRRSK